MSVANILKTASPAATRLAIGALFALAFKILILNRWPAANAAIRDLGDLLEAILASVVASYVFYLVVVHLKELDDRRTVAPYVNRHTLRVVGDCESQLIEISKVSNVSLSLETVTAGLLKQAFTEIAPYSNAPLMLAPMNAYANWFQYFDYHKSRTKESIAKVIGQLIYVDAKHVSLLAAIDDCIHFSILGHTLHSKVGNTDLSAFADTFHLYCQKCLALKQYMTVKTNHAAS